MGVSSLLKERVRSPSLLSAQSVSHGAFADNFIEHFFRDTLILESAGGPTMDWGSHPTEMLLSTIKGFFSNSKYFPVIED